MTDTSTATTWAVVVLNFRSHPLLARNLQALHDARRAGGLVVVVDNFSDAEERTAVEAFAQAHGHAFVGLPDNLGFGHGVNVGRELAVARGAEVVITLNPDARLELDTALALVEHCRADTSALVGPVVLDSTGRTASSGSALSMRTGRTHGLVPPAAEDVVRLDASGAVPGLLAVDERGWLTGACLAMHRDLWARTGGFDESMFLYWEDVDLSLRVAALGGRVVLRADLVAVHDEGGTQVARTGTAKSSLYYFWNCRNRLALAAVHLDGRMLVRWILATPRMSARIFLRGGRRQLVESPGLVWSAVRGSVSGLALAVRALVRGPRRGST